MGENHMFKVWHKKDPDFRTIPKSLTLEEFECVALVRCHDLEDAFRLTNHIDWEWWLNDEIYDVVKKSRSTSVGDVVQNMTTRKTYAVDMVGWKEITVGKRR